MARNRMRYAALLMAVGVASRANAGFIGFTCEVASQNGVVTTRLFAWFNAPTDVVLSVFGFSLGPSFDFLDNDLAGGSWAPQFTTPETEQIDSFVTIGGGPGFTNSTAADPSWGGAGFTQPTIPFGAGWFNSNPPNLQGLAGPSKKTLLAQFAWTSSSPPPSGGGNLTISFNQGLGTPTQFAQGSFCLPSPGAAIILFGVGVRSRRRCRLSAPPPAAR